MRTVSPKMLLFAYREGIFPMADARDAKTFSWYRPSERGVMPLDESFCLPRKLAKSVLTGSFDVTTNKTFQKVIENCACAPYRTQTWISRELQSLYVELHWWGYAQSIEVWRHHELVGGLYGVTLGGAFFGESMFSHVSNASKTALVHLVAALRTSGFTLLDTQFNSEHLQQFGCQTLPEEEYMKKLNSALVLEPKWPNAVSLAVLRGEIEALRKVRPSYPSAETRKMDDA